MSERIMMALGEFRFETSAASYQSLSYSQSWRWPEQARLGREPAHQFTGREKTEIKLSGTLYPSFRGGLSSIEALRAIADSGEPQLLVDGLGRVWGSWVILSVNDNRSVLLDDGQPRKIGFDLTLREYGEDDTLDFSGWTPFGALLSITGLFEAGEILQPPPWTAPDTPSIDAILGNGVINQTWAQASTQLWAILPEHQEDSNLPVGPAVAPLDPWTWEPIGSPTFVGNLDLNLLAYYPRAYDNPSYAGRLTHTNDAYVLFDSEYGLWTPNPGAPDMEVRGAIFVVTNSESSQGHPAGWIPSNNIDVYHEGLLPNWPLTKVLESLSKRLILETDIEHFRNWVRENAAD